MLSLASDGKLHSHYVSNGDEPSPAIPFLPPNAHAIGLIVVNDVAYAATANKCGGVENGIWAVDLKTGKIATWKTTNKEPTATIQKIVHLFLRGPSAASKLNAATTIT